MLSACRVSTKTELLWVIHADRLVSERMLAVDRRITGRNTSLFQRFAAAARTTVLETKTRC